ncbi:MAG: hypothetical protein KAG56_08885 [Sulfurovaceae bacterium]|nr:hypothetical protein [Sulfurovaceae bacterium]
MEEFFIISTRKIDSDWSLSDLRDDNHVLDYCEEVLDIPEEFIMDATLTGEGLEISLGDLSEEDLLIDNDWYIQLRRISNTARQAA